MGGLIVRCMVQRIIPNDPDAGGHLGSGADFVERISPTPPHTAASSSRSVVACWRRSATSSRVQGADIFDTEWSIPKKATRICVAFCSATCGSRSN
jgi:hypothetical protein